MQSDTQLGQPGICDLFMDLFDVQSISVGVGDSRNSRCGYTHNLCQPERVAHASSCIMTQPLLLAVQPNSALTVYGVESILERRSLREVAEKENFAVIAKEAVFTYRYKALEEYTCIY